MSKAITEMYGSKLFEPHIPTTKKRRLSIDFFQQMKTMKPKVRGRRLSTGFQFTTKRKTTKQEPITFQTPSKNFFRSQSVCVIDCDITSKKERNLRTLLSTPIRNITEKISNVSKSCSKISPKRTRSLPKIYNRKLAVNLKTSISVTSLPTYSITTNDDVLSTSGNSPHNKYEKRNIGVLEKEQSSCQFGVLPKKRKSDYFLALTSWRTEKINPASNLKEYLKKKSRLIDFREFLEKEFSEENLDFWIEVESYKNLKVHKQKKIASLIYETFIKVGAQKEVNIDARTRQKTKENVVKPTSSSFALAQERVYILMERDSFPRYLLKKTNVKPLQKMHPLRNNKKLKTSSSCILKIDSNEYSKSISSKPSLEFDSIISVNVTQRRKRKNSF